MSPSHKKKKGKHRHPPPRYRKQTKGQPPGAKEPPELETALDREPARPATARPATADRDSVRREPSTVVSLDPLAPIIVRSGRPMEGRTDADPAQFPPPSTVAGCLRTAWARARDQHFGTAPVRADVVQRLLQVPVAGPLLLDADGGILAPKPADAIYFAESGLPRCVRAEPREPDARVGTDLPEGLLPVRLSSGEVSKAGDGPRWWSWEDLLTFRRGESVPFHRLSSAGWSPPRGDLRTHVSIGSTTGAVVQGALFQTEGLDLSASPAAFCTNRREVEDGRETGSAVAAEDSDGATARGLRLLARCGEALGATLVHLGGKRRLAALEPEPEDMWPTPPDGWLERIRQAGGLCLTLLTPAVFSDGYRPGWLDDTLTGSSPGAPGLTLRLRAAAVERWQPHSGWDLAERRPKATRKLVPAGATYWFDVIGACDKEALSALWLASICDDPQDRRDGFGLALPGPWTPPAVAARIRDF